MCCGFRSFCFSLLFSCKSETGWKWVGLKVFCGPLMYWISPKVGECPASEWCDFGTCSDIFLSWDGGFLHLNSLQLPVLQSSCCFLNDFSLLHLKAKQTNRNNKKSAKSIAESKYFIWFYVEADFENLRPLCAPSPILTGCQWRSEYFPGGDFWGLDPGNAKPYSEGWAGCETCTLCLAGLGLCPGVGAVGSPEGARDKCVTQKKQILTSGNKNDSRSPSGIFTEWGLETGLEWRPGCILNAGAAFKQLCNLECEWRQFFWPSG